MSSTKLYFDRIVKYKPSRSLRSQSSVVYGANQVPFFGLNKQRSKLPFSFFLVFNPKVAEFFLAEIFSENFFEEFFSEFFLTLKGFSENFIWGIFLRTFFNLEIFFRKFFSRNFFPKNFKLTWKFFFNPNLEIFLILTLKIFLTLKKFFWILF